MVLAHDDGALQWREVGDVLVVLHGRAAPSDARWNELVFAASMPLSDGRRRPRNWSAVLIYSLGGMPTVTQRAKLGTTLTVTGETPTVALVSASPLARGVLTAVRWVVPALRSIRAFAPEQRAAAVQALGLDVARREDVDAALNEMLRASAER